jgi:general stress protein 26
MGKEDKATAIRSALELTRRVRFVNLATLDEDGFPETRTLFNLRKTRAKALSAGPAALPEASFGAYLGTNASSRKNAQIRKDPRVCLYYSDNASFQGLSLRGRLEEVSDPAVRKSIYTASWDMYYPGGRDGGDFCLLRFVPERGRYYHGLSVTAFDARDRPAPRKA